ncbi:MAG: hypothetical protein NZ899_06340 [Thermoguttaceae bacterium]|nr:hypothetical protein [Thermoguttaceae bacterium]MDW8079221.1 hypothetical protein [Thermoguttaceae bacterium]
MVYLGQTVVTGLFETRPSVWEMTTRGQIVLRRSVSMGVVYEPPPVPEGWPRWTKVRGGQIEYEMAFPSFPDAVFSFGWWCGELRAQSSLWQQYRCGQDPTPEPLLKLDQIVDKILTLASHLHQAGWGLGLITPDNIFVFETNGQLTVSFTDLGFSWGSHSPLVPPNFMRKAAEGNAMANLWDGGDPQRQLERGRPIPAAEFDPGPDIRALVRVFITALLRENEHEYFADVPSPDVRPETAVQWPHIPGGRRVWSTLASILAEGAQSVEELRQRLEETPLSQHFMAEAPAGLGRRWTRRLALAVGSLLCGAALGGYLFVQGRKEPPPPITGPVIELDPLKKLKEKCDRLFEEVRSIYRECQQSVAKFFEVRRKLAEKRKEVKDLYAEVNSRLQELRERRSRLRDADDPDGLKEWERRLTECGEKLDSLEVIFSEVLR